MHLGRLSKFSRPLSGKEVGFKIALDKNIVKESTGLPTELRTAALINELRSFMLKKDPASFYCILRIVSKYYRNYHPEDILTRDSLKRCKKIYTSNVLGAKLSIIINYKDGYRLDNWGEFLDILIYGKYIHNKPDKVDRLLVTEENLWLNTQCRADFTKLTVCTEKFLRSFDEKYVQPILKLTDYPQNVRLVQYEH
jgi:hypothetical protein